jgi:hypothetical protein
MNNRAFIWRCLLRLPENHAAYAALVEKGGHLTFAKLQEHYPLKSRKLLRIMQRYRNKDLINLFCFYYFFQCLISISSLVINIW